MARENFGPVVAQVGAVALMLDYIVTVAVQASAGTAAVTSAIPALSDYQLEITVGVVLVLFYGNLRGLREAGRLFAFPTYFFIACMAVVIIGGLVREILGDLPHYDPTTAVGAFPVGEGSPLLSIGAVYILMKSFANGGSSLTGLEAISNGVSTFRPPQGFNARRTLVIMSVLLGTLVAGVSWLAHETHAVAYESGSPTVISQVAKAVAAATRPFGHVMFFVVQLATMLILWTGANTPFNGFPYLANFVAADGFLPRWLTKRGHRLAFSNGIIVLAVIALALILGTGAHVDELVAFYAIGVFTGFTLAGFGMARYFTTHREGRWRVKVIDQHGRRGRCRRGRPHLRRHEVHRGRLARRRGLPAAGGPAAAAAPDVPGGGRAAQGGARPRDHHAEDQQHRPHPRRQGRPRRPARPHVCAEPPTRPRSAPCTSPSTSSMPGRCNRRGTTCHGWTFRWRSSTAPTDGSAARRWSSPNGP